MNNESIDFDALLDSVNTVPTTEVAAKPGSEENPIVGVKRRVRGMDQFYAYSGADRRAIRRQGERDAKNESDHGRISYWKQQHAAEFKAGTRRQQLRILRGEIDVTPAMRNNLERAILAEQRAHEAAPLAQERADKAEQRRIDRHATRQLKRILDGNPRHSDLVAYGHRAA